MIHFEVHENGNPNNLSPANEIASAVVNSVSPVILSQISNPLLEHASEAIRRCSEIETQALKEETVRLHKKLAKYQKPQKSCVSSFFSRVMQLIGWLVVLSTAILAVFYFIVPETFGSLVI